MGLNRDSGLTAANGSGADRLTGWKQIAAYADREPRTVQLWEPNATPAAMAPKIHAVR
jgi:hypothetical protein